MLPRPAMEEVIVPIPDTTEPTPSSSCHDKVNEQCNIEFCKSVFTVRDMFCPASFKKALWFSGLAAALGGVIAVEVITGAFTTAATYESYIALGLLYAIDPLVQSVLIVTAKYPPALQDPANTFIDLDAPRTNNDEVAIIIPTHYAAAIIEGTIRSCLQHVQGRQIYILDNSESEDPVDNTREIVRNIDRTIHYYWGHIGNKTFAQLVGAWVAKNYKYIFAIDHDMRLPRLFDFKTHLITDDVKAVCYPIRAVHEVEGQTNLLVRWQDIEYLLAGCAKQSQSRFGGVLYPHGAVSMWERETFLQVLMQHDAIFYAEDVKLGMILNEMGYRMAIAGSAYLDTIVPTTLFGKKLNLYEQRVRSWEMGRQRYTLRFAKQLFTTLPATHNPFEFLYFKLNQFYAVYSNLVDWWRLPMFIIMAAYPSYWMRMAIIVAAGNVPVLLWNYVKLPLADRKDLQCNFLDLITYPAFKLIESALSVGGITRLLAVVIPNYTAKPNVEMIVKSFQNDRSKLMDDVITFEHKQVNPPITYKRVMYDRFFKPAITHDEILEEFDYTSFMVP